MVMKGLLDKYKLMTGKADCSKYEEIMMMLLDGEATTSQEKYLRRHMKLCLQCLDHYNLDSEVKKLIRSKLNRIAAPDDLAQSIRNKITENDSD